MGFIHRAFQNAVGGYTGINGGNNYILVCLVIVASKEAPFFHPERTGLMVKLKLRNSRFLDDIRPRLLTDFGFIRKREKRLN